MTLMVLRIHTRIQELRMIGCFCKIFPINTGWERTRQMLCIVDTSLSVLMTLRMCFRELLSFYCLDLNHLVRVFYLFMFS